MGLAVNRSLELCLLLSYWHVVVLIRSTRSFRCLFWKDTWKDPSLEGEKPKSGEILKEASNVQLFLTAFWDSSPLTSLLPHYPFTSVIFKQTLDI